jgi:hypothetical protein
LASIPKRQPGDLEFRLETNVERGQRLREHSYAHPLDVRMHMSVPVNAPPVDLLLKVGHDSVPVVSLSVLTPTEVRRLQRDHHDMRNLVLSRIQRCPYPDCGAVYPANQPAAMQQHLREKHVAMKCNFCDEPLFEHWSTQQRYQHFMQKHWHVLRSMVPQEGDDQHVQIFDKGRVDHEIEGRWSFCPRCGRDHSILDLAADRQHHDNVCYPGAQNRKTDWSACGACGKRIHEGAEGERHAHRANVDGQAPFCEGCALPLGLFSEAYRVKHLSFCRGHGRDDAKYCPWCGVELAEDVDERLVHIENCARKPGPDAQGPIDMAAYFFPGSNPVPAAEIVEEERPAKRRRTDRAAEATAQASKTTPKKSAPQPSLPLTNLLTPSRGKANIPPIITTHRKVAAGEPSGGSVSPPPSTSHSKRSQEAWVPPPRPAGPRAKSAPPKPASPGKPAPSKAAFTKPTKAAANPKTPSPAKAKTAKQTPPSTTKPSKGKPTPSPAKPSTPAAAPGAPPRRYNTRSATKRKRTAANEAADAGTTTAVRTAAQAPKAAAAKQTTTKKPPKQTKRTRELRPRTRHTAKPARTVSYAEPLVRGALVSGEDGGRARVDEEGRLMPAMKKRRVGGDGEGDIGEGVGYGMRLAGVGTRWGV